MTTRNARVAGALLLCLLSAGCATLRRQAFSEPEVTVDAKALAGGIQSPNFDLDLQIYNPNHYRLDASQIAYTLAVDSIDLATGLIERRVTLKPRDSATVRVPVAVDTRSMMRLLIPLMTSDSLSFQLVGTMRIETIFGSVTRPFDQRGTYETATGRVTIIKRK